MCTHGMRRGMTTVTSALQWHSYDIGSWNRCPAGIWKSGFIDSDGPPRPLARVDNTFPVGVCTCEDNSPNWASLVSLHTRPYMWGRGIIWRCCDLSRPLLPTGAYVCGPWGHVFIWLCSDLSSLLVTTVPLLDVTPISSLVDTNTYTYLRTS